MKKYIITIISLFSVIILLLITNITVSNITSTGGIDLSRLQNNLHDVQKENILLQEKVLHLSSFDHIASSAATLGFVPDTKQISLSDAPQLAYKQ